MSIRLSRISGRAGRGSGAGWGGGMVKMTAALVLTITGTALVSGCSGQPAAPPSSVTACTRFGASAIRRHVTVTVVPAACRGLSQAEVNVAVGQALRAAAAGVRGRARQRRLIGRASQYLSGLVRAVPAASQSATAAPATSSPATAPVATAAPSRATLGLAALVAWLVTVGLGLSMMARWVTRTGRPRGGRAPVLNYAHFGLAVAGLLAWAGYLASGVTGLGWAACGLLLPVAGLGMTLVFLVPSRATVATPDATVLASADTTVLASTGPPARRPAPLVIAAHIIAASVTILLAVLAAAGSG